MKIIFNLRRCIAALLFFVVLFIFACGKEGVSVEQKGVIDHSVISGQKSRRSAITVVVTDPVQALPLISANGGFSTEEGSAFAAKSLKVSITKRDETSALLKDLYSQKADIAILPYWQVVREAGNFSAKMVCVFSLTGFSDGAHAGYSRDPREVQTVKDLSGRVIACKKDSEVEFLAQFLLKLNSLSPDTIQWLYVKGDREAVAALASKKADAAFVNTPAADAASFTLITSTSGYTRLMPYVLAANERWLLTHSDEAKMITDLMLQETVDTGKWRKKLSQIPDIGQEISGDQIDTFLPAVSYDVAGFFGIINSSPVQALYIDTIEEYLPENLSTKKSYLYYSHLNSVFVSPPESSAPPSSLSVRNTHFEIFSAAVVIDGNMPQKDEYASISATLLRVLPFLDNPHIRVSYLPARGTGDRYIAESATGNFHKELMETLSLKYEQLERDYESYYKPFQSDYTGPYADKPSVKISVYR